MDIITRDTLIALNDKSIKLMIDPGYDLLIENKSKFYGYLNYKSVKEVAREISERCKSEDMFVIVKDKKDSDRLYPIETYIGVTVAEVEKDLREALIFFRNEVFRE